MGLRLNKGETMLTNNTDLNTKNICIYYDGLCHLCSREINQYRKMKGSENIAFVDITGSHFDANKAGLDPVKVHQSLHVRDKSGALHIGVDAFVRIWSELPSLKFLVPIAQIKPIYAALNYLYTGFAQLRPLLPRKSCESSPYCEVHTRS